MSDLRCPNCRCSLELTTTGTEPYKAPFVLATAVSMYADEQRKTGAWSSGWAPAAEAQLRRFADFGAPLNRKEVAAFRGSLVIQGLATKTVNLYLTTLSGFCRWLVNRGDLTENPCPGQYVRNGHAAKCDQRLAFTPIEVREILSYVREFAPTPGHAGFVWAMAYTGARNEEIGQLRLCDFYHKDGEDISVFDLAVMDGAQHRKSEASRRLIPVSDTLHTALREILLEPPHSRAETVSFNLWGFSANSTGRFSYGVSRWFNRKVLPALKEVYGLVRDDPRLTLYSLRHSVLTQLKHKDVAEHLIAELAGHANGSITTGRYGKKFPLKKLKEVVEKLQW